MNSIVLKRIEDALVGNANKQQARFLLPIYRQQKKWRKVRVWVFTNQIPKGKSDHKKVGMHVATYIIQDILVERDL